MPRSLITGTGRSLPARIVTNDDLAALMDTSDEWIRSRTGIEQRHWIEPGERGVSLGREAALQALTAAALEPAALDAILYATSTPDHFLPGNGVYLQRELGIAATIPAIDLRMQCAGFIYALSVADAYIRSGAFRRILVVGQEIQSTRMDISTEGRHTAVIFADGAGAVVLEASEAAGRGILAFDLHGDGSHAEKLWVEGPGALVPPDAWAKEQAEGRYWLRMDGREVFRHAVVRMPESVRAALGRAGENPAGIKLLIAHQANLRISEAVQKELALREEQTYNNIQRYGNTTAATIPIALDECARSGQLQAGDLVVLTAFGSGFVWGSCVLRW
ncbi:MAG TPA: beta-ketoacyl-ACP synthase III [Gemmatimonadales bacterium]|jgi:3-oxoacyl-[acyl-carrier-protein] synthase-3|nr:beta-ketoacyl-ACP synthase III [Gemmatimonadales bacterium]